MEVGDEIYIDLRYQLEIKKNSKIKSIKGTIIAIIGGRNYYQVKITEIRDQNDNIIPVKYPDTDHNQVLFLYGVSHDDQPSTG